MTEATAVSTEKQPRAVRKSADRANQLIEESRRRRAGEPAAPAPTPAATPDPAPTPADPQPDQPTVQVAPAPQPRPSPTPSGDPREQDPGYWKARYESSLGAFRVDKARLEGTIDGLNGRITDLEQQLANRQPATPVIDPAKMKLEEFFSPDEVKEFGPDALRSLMGGVVKVVAQQVGATVKPIESRVRTLAEDGKDRRYKQFLADVADPRTGVPNWQAVNADPAWLAWLAQPDEVSGIERQQLLNKAHANMDAPRVIAIFKSFLSTQPGGGQRPPLNRDERVMPIGGRPSGGTGTPLPADTPVTRADIKAHYERKHRDRGWAKSEECKTAETRINAAVSAGLVND